MWKEWIERNDFSKVTAFINTMYASPNIFGVPVKNVFWMNPSTPLSEVLPLDIFDYQRPGGSVAHAAFDLLVEFGCSSIALVGQDLAYSKNNVPRFRWNYSKLRMKPSIASTSCLRASCIVCRRSTALGRPAGKGRASAARG